MIRNSDTNESAHGLGQKDFLRLIIAQLQHQTPKQPQTKAQDSFEEHSINNDVRKMQESLQQMACSLQSNQALQASALVGRKVLVISNQFYLGTKESVSLSVEPSAGVKQVSIDIYSESGRLIKAIPLSDTFQMKWDGLGQDKVRQAPGIYTVIAKDKDKKILKTLILANVDSVKLGRNGEGLKLNLAGIGLVTLDQVRQISV